MIALDAAGTIMEPEPAVHHAYCDVANRFGYSLNPTEIKHRFPAAMNEFFPMSWDPARASTDHQQQWSAWRGLVSQVLHEIPAEEIEPVFSALWAHFRLPHHWRIYDDVEPFLQTLKSKGYGICVVSNFDRRLHEIAAGRPELATVDHWFASVDVGYQKPCAEFFRSIEQRLNLQSHELLMIGDSLQADYFGALHANWHARWLQRIPDTPLVSRSDRPPPSEIRTIQSLKDIL
jgi:putative hydrolase of the HAD superfamily